MQPGQPAPTLTRPRVRGVRPAASLAPTPSPALLPPAAVPPGARARALLRSPRRLPSQLHPDAFGGELLDDVVVEGVLEPIEVEDPVEIDFLELLVRVGHREHPLGVWHRLLVLSIAVREVRVLVALGIADAVLELQRAAQIDALQSTEARQVLEVLRGKVARVRDREHLERFGEPRLRQLRCVLGRAIDAPSKQLGDGHRVVPVELVERRASPQQRGHTTLEAHELLVLHVGRTVAAASVDQEALTSSELFERELAVFATRDGQRLSTRHRIRCAVLADHRFERR
eukprot:292639-Prymnesium_polylepis.1